MMANHAFLWSIIVEIHPQYSGRIAHQGGRAVGGVARSLRMSRTAMDKFAVENKLDEVGCLEALPVSLVMTPCLTFLACIVIWSSAA